MLIRDDTPFLLYECTEVPDSFNVGLVEGGKHEVAVVGFKLSIKILKPVLLVSERVQTDSILSVFVHNKHGERV